MSRNNFKAFFVLMLVGFISITIHAQIPQRPSPPCLVNDLANVFSEEQRQELEQELVAFNDSTSNQIVIVTVNDLAGYDKMTFAQQIGETWGVGQKKQDNGIVILLKPKNETKGEVFIAAGYGLEGALPDAICKRIVENEMIPYFRKNDYYGGMVNALRVIMPVATGEYKYKAEKKGGNSGAGLVVVVFIIVIIFLLKRGNRGNNDFTGRGGSSGLDFWTLIMMAGMANRNHSGSWGDFSGGRGGGNDSGFGGFGGGSFGGGGAGGSW